MTDFKPMNKYIVIRTVKQDEKIGMIFTPDNAAKNQYAWAEVISVDDCDESKGLEPGDTVLYDVYGAVDHRMGTSTMTTVKVLNVLGVVKKIKAAPPVDVPETD